MRNQMMIKAPEKYPVSGNRQRDIAFSIDDGISPMFSQVAGFCIIGLFYQGSYVCDSVPVTCVSHIDLQ